MEDQNTKTSPKRENEPKKVKAKEPLGPQIQAGLETTTGLDKGSEKKEKDNINFKYLSVFERAGLSNKEAKIYEILIENGQLGVGKILKKITYKRGDTYNILYSLRDKGLIEQTVKSGKIEFRPLDPNQLKTHIIDQKKRYSEAESLVDATLPDLSEMYKLTTEKPVVRFYSGKDGIKKIIDDSLRSHTPILTYLDPKAVDKYQKEANRRYVASRKKLKVSKKILVQDNQFNRQHFSDRSNNLTEVRYLKGDLPVHFTVMQIYDDKISYMTMRPNSAIGLIIDDKNIATMHRALFELNWMQSSE